MDLLLQMIEWHTQLTSDRWSPVFERGRFLEEWAPPFVVDRLHRASSRYDRDEIWNARLECLDLFRRLAEESAARLGYSYPARLEERVMTWVRRRAREARTAADATADPKGMG